MIASMRRYAQSLRWTPLPLGVGFALIAFQQYRHIRRREAAKPRPVADQWEVQAYKLLPLRTFSRLIGWATGRCARVFQSTLSFHQLHPKQIIKQFLAFYFIHKPLLIHFIIRETQSDVNNVFIL